MALDCVFEIYVVTDLQNQLCFIKLQFLYYIHIGVYLTGKELHITTTFVLFIMQDYTVFHH